MSTEKQPGAETTAIVPDTKVVSAEAKTAERTRIKAILALPEAATRMALANHLALTTEMSVDEAKGILAASAVEAKPAAEADPKRPNAFQQAMDQGEQPNIGAGNGGGNAEENPVLRMTSNYQKATGHKVKALN